MDDHILEMRSITKTFPGVKALEDVSLSVRRGEIHAICGENGAGKSTLMKVLSGVYPTGSYDGEIVFDGAPVHFSGIRDSEHVGIVISGRNVCHVKDGATLDIRCHASAGTALPARPATRRRRARG